MDDWLVVSIFFDEQIIILSSNLNIPRSLATEDLAWKTYLTNLAFPFPALDCQNLGKLGTALDFFSCLAGRGLPAFLFRGFCTFRSSEGCCCSCFPPNLNLGNLDGATAACLSCRGEGLTFCLSAWLATTMHDTAKTIWKENWKMNNYCCGFLMLLRRYILICGSYKIKTRNVLSLLRVSLDEKPVIFRLAKNFCYFFRFQWYGRKRKCHYNFLFIIPAEKNAGLPCPQKNFL
jgi:hypothetical protein